jgi:hypothetical protein
VTAVYVAARFLDGSFLELQEFVATGRDDVDTIGATAERSGVPRTAARNSRQTRSGDSNRGRDRRSSLRNFMHVPPTPSPWGHVSSATVVERRTVG